MPPVRTRTVATTLGQNRDINTLRLYPKGFLLLPPRSGSGWARLAAGSVRLRPPFCFSLFSPCFPPSSGVHAERTSLPYIGSSPINGFLQGSLRGRVSDWGSPENFSTTDLRSATDFATQQVCWRGSGAPVTTHGCSGDLHRRWTLCDLRWQC